MEDVEPKVRKMYDSTTKVIKDRSTPLLIERGVWGHVSWWDVWNKRRWWSGSDKIESIYESIPSDMSEYEMKGM